MGNNEEKAICPSCRTKKRSAEELRSLVNRLSRIEGQVRGIRGMVESDAYCTDVIVQACAVISALYSFNRELLSEHIRSCVTEDIRAGGEEKVEELIEIISRLSR